MTRRPLRSIAVLSAFLLATLLPLRASCQGDSFDGHGARHEPNDGDSHGAAPDGDAGGKIPYGDQLHSRIHQEFVEAQAHMARHPTYAAQIGSAWSIFDSQEYKKLPANVDYPAHAINYISQGLVSYAMSGVYRERAARDQQAGHTDRAQENLRKSNKASDIARKSFVTFSMMTRQANPGMSAPGPLGADHGATPGDLVGGRDGRDHGGRGGMWRAAMAVQNAVTESMHAASQQTGGGSSGGIYPPPVDPTDPLGAANTARDKSAQGDLSGALAAADQAVSLGGGADALALRGGIELDQSKYAQAYADANKALQLDPSNKQALAVLHLSEGRAGASASAAPAGAAGAGGAGGAS
ncbi:MAG: hypothetical protein KGM24_00595, partial [Elusimicrobia bacterium]|nr:hypothetical protein [Elusimicrobiota bacterium]